MLGGIPTNACYGQPVLISASTPDLLSPSPHSQLLLEHAAATFPGPAARSTPFDPVAAWRDKTRELTVSVNQSKFCIMRT